jgi:hypothetical protein
MMLVWAWGRLRRMAVRSSVLLHPSLAAVVRGIVEV